MDVATTQKILDRLEILRRKLEEEGSYVRANTVTLAIEEITRLRFLEILDGTKGHQNDA